MIYELAATALLIGLIVLGAKRLPGSYTLYMVLSLLMPLTAAPPNR